MLPVGAVTFLLADVERSAPRWEPAPGAADAVRCCREAVRRAASAHSGRQPGEQGQAGEVIAVFPSAAEAVAAALDVQRTVAVEAGSEGWARSVRVALHTGDAVLRDDGRYAGVALQRCGQLRDVANGGQVLLSSATASIVADTLPAGAWLRDLGLHRLRDLAPPERVSELRHADLADDLPPLRSLDAAANNLPVQLTTFVGRGDELAAVQRLLGDERWVTLTGPGGCGKTRLAMHAAAELADRWPDGLWWIDLAPVSDPALVAELVASTIGVLVEPVGGPLRALALQARDRRLLVCLDNCEHVLDASAEVAEVLLRACPEVSVLATSREPLGVAGETVWRVPPLVEDEAISLFRDRASRVRPWFSLDATNRAAVGTMCRRLDGLPLAIELAAAWLRTLTPAQIAAGLDERFALLVRGPRGAVAHHQTLAASMDWSHDLLDESDRIAFRRLGAFAGGFTLDAARRVCAGGPLGDQDVLVALGRLVDKSLVVVEERQGEARYRLLESIRQYAQDRLEEAGEAEVIRDRHLDHFLALAETAEPGLESVDQEAWLDRLETEHDNLRAALGWGLGAAAAEATSVARVERGRRLAAALAWLWSLHGHSHEGVEFLQHAIGRSPDDRSSLQARLLAALALVADTGGPLHLELDAAQRGLEIATATGDDRTRGRCLLLSAVVQFYIDADATRELCAEARRCADAAGDAFVTDGVGVLEALIPASRDRHDAARPLLREAADRCLSHGNRTFAATVRNYQIDGAAFTGEVRLAGRLAAEAVRAVEPLGDYYVVGGAVVQLAFVKGLAGEIEAGKRLTERVVRSVEGADHDVYVPRMAPVLGKLCLWSGDLDGAVAWFERDARHAVPMADSLIVARSLPGLAAALRRLGRSGEAREHIDRALALARHLDVPHLIADSLEQWALLVDADDPEQAEKLHHQALAVRLDHGLRTFYVDSLDALAGLAARAESLAEAARLLAASDAARTAMGYPRRPVDAPGHQATVAALGRGLGARDLREAGTGGAALALDDAVAYARRARGGRGRPSTGWASLTPTELDVVRGVVEGLTNPEIGSRLFMSRGTVKTHLSHVYAKLHVANRTELATLATTRLGE